MAIVRKTVSARECRRSSQIFNVGSMTALLAPVPIALLFPHGVFAYALGGVLVTLWFAGSILAYALVAHHPEPRVSRYNRIAGYRFYGWAGLLPTALIFSDTLHELAGGTLAMWIWVWVLGVLIVVPMGIFDLIRARKENWRDITVEVEKT